MKKLTLLLFINFLFFQLLILPRIANAINANPYPVEFIQPDGSKITIQLKGDEKVRWAETMDGYSILFNKEGTYEYAILNAENNMVTSGIQARNLNDRTIDEKNFLDNIQKSLHYSAQQVQMMQSAWGLYASEPQNAFPTTGNRNLICILIGYTDVPFTKTNADFTNLFNQINYTTGGATGSVKDYYLESSYNQLNLTVTVAGPYTASNTMAYFGANDAGGNDVRPRELAAEAVTLADPDVNYANFDNDNNGSVDGVYVIFAGYGEEAGASANTIWSHAWNLATTLTLDGKSISKYSCSPELRGTSGTNITYIGVICHEFGHVLGSPDFYDTNYSTGGSFNGTGSWDLMANGSWNNGGKTPAHHNAYIKTVVYGWASYTTLSAGAHVTLYNSAENLNSFYRFNSTTANEYFLLENRQQLKFDANIPGHGLIIYHVHATIGTSSINTTHPQKMYPVCASATTNPSATPADYGSINTGGCPYPGTAAKTSFTDATTPWAKSWAGANTAKPITSISENITNKTVSFDFMGGVSCTLPTAQATGFSSSAITDNSMTVGWTRGTGNSVLVVARKGSAVNDIPVNSLSYTANAAFGSGTEIGTGNFVVYNGPGTSVNITSLLSGTTYYFAVYEYTSSTFCYLTPALTGNAMTTGNPPITYCIASATTCDEYIGNVTIGTINNSTACTSGGYADYSAISTNITQGASLAITVANPVPYSADQCGIWVDWNYNGDLTDDVAITVTGSPGGGPYSATITCPANAPLGSKRLRVRVHYNNETTSPCGNAVYGEVEDYSINVVASCTPPSAPLIGTITQPTCSLATGSVILNGLPASGTWTLTRTPGNVTTTGTGITKTISGLAAGTYTYTVTDATPCTSVASANVVINTQPATPSAPTAGNNGPVCAGKTLSLTASTVSGATYSWTGPNSFTSTSQNPTVSASATPAMAGTYSVTAIANGCTSQAGTTTVVVNSLPTITANASPATICSGASSSLTANSSITPATFTWNPGGLSGTPVSVSPSSTTIYTVSGNVTATGCTATTIVTVTVNPNPVITPAATPSTICAGASSSLSATSTVGGTTYVWSPGGLTGTPVSVTPGSSTTYTVTGTASGCTGSATVTITVNPIPVLTPVATPAAFCAGASSSLSVSSSIGGTTFQWMPGGLNGTPVSVTPNSTTTYTVTGTAAGCSGTSTIIVTVNPKPVITPTASPAAICIGASSSLSATSSVGGTTYIWNPGSLSGSPVNVNPVSTITYTVTGTSPNGCTGSASLTVTVNPLPILTPAATPNQICRWDNSTLSVTPQTNTTYIWMPGSLSGSSIIVSPASTITYTVSGTNSVNGCTASATVMLTVNQRPFITATSSPSNTCSNANSTLSANCTANCTGITYNWTPGGFSGSSIIVHPLATTTYTVTGNNSNGCTQSTSVILTVNPNPVITPTATPAVIISGSSSSLSASSSLSGTTFVWNPGALAGTPVTVSPVSTTTYTVIGTASGCTGSSSILVTVNPPTKTLQVKVFIGGLYVGNGMMREASDFNPINETFPPKWNTGIADTVSVVLYNDTYTDVVAKFPGVYLNTDGTLTISGISSSLSNSYYITIFQRNSVPITSATPRSFAGSVISYDFTTPAEQAYGNQSQKLLSGSLYGMYTGELDQDEFYSIDGFDLSLLEFEIITGPYGFLKTDLNGDGVVDGYDLIIMEPNIVLNPIFWNPLIAK